MADRLATLGIVVDPSGAIAGTTAVNTALKTTQAQSAVTTGMMKSQWASVGKTFALVAGAAAGIGAGFTAISALSEFAKFQQGMRNVAAVSVSTANELKLLEQAALDMAIATRYNPEQTTQALYALASQGLSAAESIAVLPNVLALAEAGQADLGKATELVVSTMAQFGIAATDSQRVVDVLTASIGESAANVHRLQVGMAAAGPASNALGQSFEDTVAAVAILTTALGNGEMAGTGVKTILGQLAAESKKMGLDVWDATNQMKPLSEIMDQIAERGISIETIWKRLGLRGGPAMSALLEVGSDGLREMSDAIKANGQAATIASKQLDTLKGDVDQLGSSTDVFQVTLGRLGEGPARDFIQFLTEQVRSLTRELPAANGELTKLVDTWGFFFDMVGEGLDQTSKEYPAVFDDLFNRQAGQIEKSLTDWTFYWEAVRDFPLNAMTFFQLFGNEITYQWERSKIATHNAVLYMWEQWEWLLNKLQIGWANIKGWWSELMDDLKTVAADAIYQIADAIELLPFDSGREWAESLKKSAEGLLEQADGAEQVAAEIAKVNAEYAKTKIEIEGLRGENKAALDEAHAAYVQRIDEILDQHNKIKDMLQDTTGVLEEVEVTAERMKDLILEVPSATTEVVDEFEAMSDAWAEELGEMVDELEEMEKEFAQIWQRILKSLDAGDIKPLMAEVFRTLFEQGGGAAGDLFKRAWEENSTGIIAGGLALGNDLIEGYQDYRSPTSTGGAGMGKFDSVVNTLWDTFSPIIAMAGPWGAAIVAAVEIIDAITGGGLLGTSYKVENQGYGFDIGEEGAFGSQYVTESRKRSFFRGTKTRITESNLDQGIIDAIEDLFDGIQEAMLRSATALGVSIPEMISGSFEEQFDADGKIIKQISTVLGRTYTEGFEDFAKRISAENILAVISQQFGEVEVANNFGRRGAGLFNYGRGGFLPNGELPFEGDFNQTGNDQFGTQMMNEVQVIAERWRDDAELLLEGAEFLLIVAGELKSGFNLLEDGTLTNIVDLIEELNFAGESLKDTYARVAGSFRLLQQAMGLTGVVIEGTREEIVKFATEITNAAGGLEVAQGLWNSFFNNYFSQAELTNFLIGEATSNISRLREEIGAEDVNFGNFREAFEAALPTLSPEDIVTWLQLGQALAGLNELTGGLGVSLQEMVEAYGEDIGDMSSLNMTLADSVDAANVALWDAIDAYDGSTDAETRLMGALKNRYEMELRFLAMIEQAATDIDSMLNKTIESIRLSVMSDSDQYDYLKAKAESLADTIPTITDPEELTAVIAEIDAITRQAYGLLSPEQQQQYNEDFVGFLETVNENAQIRLEELRTDMQAEREENQEKLALMFDNFADKSNAAAESMQSAANSMNNAAGTMNAAANRLATTTIPVSVEITGSQGYDMGGL